MTNQPTPTAPADAGTPPPVIEHRFVVRSVNSVVVVNGKSFWPNMLRLQMDRNDAFCLMQSLIAQLRDSGNKCIEVQWMGQMTEEHDE